MPNVYQVKPAADLLSAFPDVVALSDLHSGAYANFGIAFGPDDLIDDRDGGTSVTLARDVTEPGLAERWSRYDAAYRNDPRIRDFWTGTIGDALVLPNMMVLKDGAFVRESIRLSKTLCATLPDVDPALVRRALRRPDEAMRSTTTFESGAVIDGPCFLLGAGMFANYFNWTIRYASRIRLFQALDASFRLLAPSSAQPYIAGALEFFGVAAERVAYVDRPVTVRSLMIGSSMALGRYELSPVMIQTLRGRPEVAHLRRPGETGRIYVPRRNVAMRRVLNEDEVIRFMSGRGYRIFDNAEHSVRDQVEAFANADDIVAPHGAGLSNIVYAPRGARVVELIPEGYDQGVTSYRSLSDLFGHRYAALICKEEVVDRKNNRCNSDISVSIADLDALLAR